MLRKLHGLPGLLATLFFLVLTTSGAVLSIVPSLERSAAIIPAAGELSVAQLAERVLTNFPTTEQITRTASGEIIVYHNGDNQPSAVLVNPIQGTYLAPYQPSTWARWVKNLHRSFLLGDSGRALAGISAVLMVLICLSGITLLVQRLGGWSALLRPIAGSGSQRVHAELARFTVVALLISALTGSYMSSVHFGILPDAANNEPSFPEQVSGGTPVPVGTLTALQNVDSLQLKELVFPYLNDVKDFYSLTTTQGAGYIDQASGELLQFTPSSGNKQLQHWITVLHTGKGLWWFGLLLGFASLGVPALCMTGIKIWWQRRSNTLKPTVSAKSEQADTIILVGSEGNSTWGFAQNLQQQLVQAGKTVHCAAMNELASDYPKATTLFILTSTYGDGGAPSNANKFLAQLDLFNPKPQLHYAVLGFGDQQFPKFCQFGLDVDQALSQKGLQRILPITRINRCSATEFRHWGEDISKHLNIALTLNHNPAPAATTTFQLIDRIDYGVAVNAPTSILRFKPVQSSKKLWHTLRLKKRQPVPSFAPGDLFGITPPQGHSPRLYSLASSSNDGVLEICVRKQPQGLCSNFLHNLHIGDQIDGFIQHNPSFRPARGTQPIILVGAGAGIGPLAGFIRQNVAHNPMYLYWGGRNPESDFLYEPELNNYLKDERLCALNTAFSRATEKAYVQDAIQADAQDLRQLIAKGAQVLVCGSRDMANGVSQVFDNIVQPLHLSVAHLKAQGRYLEDVY
ncbi:PepSY domain-containing protein [Denitrificimonas sp. JX-1]|uniref:PepSY domain-containing protein n=1 Tax=Denitrificimonas halotolerans TaxID=3098930 RepID=A0ABU5GTE6_9GAMM|nr:PepSY domain-containing protein [Denitrificimonas sp. JX-1]MDY7220139.1 PepSY domain-containing protein [Denitrificimonas sp. JX-1]